MAIQLSRPFFDQMCKFLDITLTSAQAEATNALFKGERFLAPIIGRRGGKTLFGTLLDINASSQTNTTGWIIAPTYEGTQRVWNYLVPMLRKMYGSRMKINLSRMMIVFPWGSTIQCKSADRPDSLVGEGLDWMHLDEPALYKNGKVVWQQMLRPALMDREGSAWFTTTPRGYNWFYDMLHNDKPGADKVWWKQFPSHTNTFIKPGELEAIAATLDAVIYKQEILASFVAFAGMVYPMFEMGTHVMTEAEAIAATENWSTCIACDPGLNNTLIQLIKHNRVTGEDIVMRDVKLQNQQFDDALNVINEWMPREGYEAEICDIAGKARGHQTGMSFVSWMRQHGHNFRHTSVKSIPDGVIKVRGRLKNYKGVISLKFADTAEHTIKMLLNYHFPEKIDDKTQEPVKDGIYDHAGDALRYYITWRYRGTSKAVKH